MRAMTPTQLGDRDGSAGVEEVEGVGALECELVGAEGREAEDLQRVGVLFSKRCLCAREKSEALGFVEFEVLPEAGDVGVVEGVGGELLFFVEANVAVGEFAA